jgi:hypothetical protein
MDVSPYFANTYYFDYNSQDSTLQSIPYPKPKFMVLL